MTSLYAPPIGDMAFCVVPLWNPAAPSGHLTSIFITTGFLGISSLSREFFYVRDGKTWKDAQLYCRTTYTDLATIDSMNEKTRAKGNVDFLYIGSVWIGLTKVGYIHWGWSMGENTLSDYNNWNKEQPDNSFLEGHCGAISQINGYWSSVSCLEILNFACQCFVFQLQFLHLF
uniref:C-type lectin domain-containing protein n=1 Tax=Astyanax mexicanus TaxID=7994 RepID=A0A8B9HI29_ASTMX